MKTQHSDQPLSSALVIATLGVVFGDIGTSPLYALKECFNGSHPMPVTEDNIFGVLSLIVWSLIIIVSIKYLGFVMRADNRGEGGILALLSLVFPERSQKTRRSAKFMAVGVFGAALLYGDGIITPAISVVSAVEGLNVATPMFEQYVPPISVVILIGLFSLQRVGTGKVGNVFGPVTCVWFLVMAILGIRGIAQAPGVIAAINPYYAIRFFIINGWEGFVVLGAVFLAVTGAEALYADMGHFGVRPIRLGWFVVVFPSLVLNYFGQGGLLIKNPDAATHPFYNLAPTWALYPLVLLATAATIIASQALISGVFSLTVQAIQLGYLPRIAIKHTSAHQRGQIYLPQINWSLMLACVGLIMGFQSSTRMAAAYGIAVTLTMIITTLLFYFAARLRWRWPAWKAAALTIAFITLEIIYFGANFLKVAHGGWFPLVVGAAIFTLMTTWKTGRKLLFDRVQAGSLPYEMFVKDILNNPPNRVKGTAVFLSGNPDGTPIALLHNLKHNKVLHERTVLMTILTDEIPHVDPAQRLQVENIGMGLHRVIAHYGFMEEPNIPRVLDLCKDKGLEFRLHETSFFVSRETILATNRPGMALWREKLFALMARNAQRATDFFQLPANRVVEMGMQVEL